MSTFHFLPPELLEEILENCDPKSVANFSETCRLLYGLVYSTPSKTLWRTLFFSMPFDDPCRCLNPVGEPTSRTVHDFDWKGELQCRFRAQTVLWKPSCCRDEGELYMVLDTLVSMIQLTPPATPFANAEDLSQNLTWIVAEESLRGCMSTFIDGLHDKLGNLSGEIRQLLARLHTLFGLTVKDRISKTRTIQARSFVYDLRNYNSKNHWGPFFKDGSDKVNWEHIQHIMFIMSSQASSRSGIIPMNIRFCQSYLEQSDGEYGYADWAGVQGHWQCAFCYIDHRDLLAFNAQEPLADGSRTTDLFEGVDFYEAYRIINIYFTIKNIIPNPDHPQRPTIRFQGDIHGIHTMIGDVSMTKDHTVRWHFTSGEEENMIWSSEGVQIGSVQSGYGVLGTWTTVFHEEGDPVGPFWLHKSHDSSMDEDDFP